ncbi:hypothetical protein Bcep1808_7715 (plasmid) [Burkholderia vietnamiensis G4]|uniref:Uncharacterized protein n=1 Tax=Burkholderia vietnamiensis (strain G4 / LMG 22486) TaxID=269482 RepID=A4JWD2_BURVG|nr:hypothetical protein Bcep1808_7715 [Burkholderia vietnamiensis G4]
MLFECIHEHVDGARTDGGVGQRHRIGGFDDHLKRLHGPAPGGWRRLKYRSVYVETIAIAFPLCNRNIYISERAGPMDGGLRLCCGGATRRAPIQAFRLLPSTKKDFFGIRNDLLAWNGVLRPHSEQMFKGGAGLRSGPFFCIKYDESWIAIFGRTWALFREGSPLLWAKKDPPKRV